MQQSDKLIANILVRCEIEKQIEQHSKKLFTTNSIKDVLYNNRYIIIPDICAN